jgi:hypothetical protein
MTQTTWRPSVAEPALTRDELATLIALLRNYAYAIEYGPDAPHADLDDPVWAARAREMEARLVALRESLRG